MLIDFIGENDNLGVLGKYVGKPFKFFAAIHASGGVGRRTKDYEARFWGDCRFELLGCYFEVLLNTGRDCNAFPFGEFHHFYITYPCRGGDYYLIAGINYRQDAVAKRLFGSIRHDYLFGGELNAIFVFQQQEC